MQWKGRDTRVRSTCYFTPNRWVTDERWSRGMISVRRVFLTGGDGISSTAAFRLFLRYLLHVLPRPRTPASKTTLAAWLCTLVTSWPVDMKEIPLWGRRRGAVFRGRVGVTKSACTCLIYLWLAHGWIRADELLLRCLQYFLYMCLVYKFGFNVVSSVAANKIFGLKGLGKHWM